jgi:hypothetical protein
VTAASGLVSCSREPLTTGWSSAAEHSGTASASSLSTRTGRWVILFVRLPFHFSIPIFHCLATSVIYLEVCGLCRVLSGICHKINSENTKTIFNRKEQDI